MPKIYLSLLLLTLLPTAMGANWVAITSPVPASAKSTLIFSDIDHSVVCFMLSGFNLCKVQTPKGVAFTIEVGNATPILEDGAPDLPKMTLSLIIPGQAGMSARVVSSRFKDYPDVAVAPSKGAILRDTDPTAVPFRYGASYTTDQYYPGTLAGTREPFIIRGLRGQTLIAYPFQYNPATRVLRVYYDITLELYKTTENGTNPIPSNLKATKAPQGFLSVYRHQFANLSALSHDPLSEYGNLLVICYGPFMNAMRPYIAWKRAIGYHTEMINKNSIGSTAAKIRSFIANYYHTKGLAHVLLVGDAQQIPTNTGSLLGGPSDNAYGYIVGNDHYADVFVGRFSAETEAQVQTQVQRTIDYEKNPQFITDDWLTTVIGIASSQGPGDDNELDYGHVRNLQTKLLSYTYTSNPELFDGSQGGNDAPENPNPAMVGKEINNGASFVFYTGHGDNLGWGTSGFSISYVNQLTNVGKLPFIWSVACMNGNFTSGTCFAEAWMRASKGGGPTGALAFLGSTINQSWNPPMEGQDAMTDILVEQDSANIKQTFAGISINGCMKMIDSYGAEGAIMADTWTIFGDPTLTVRTAVPQPLIVKHDTALFFGDSILSVYCRANGARATAMLGDSILATGLVANDLASLSFPALTYQADTLHLIVTAYNMLPYEGKLAIHEAPVVATIASLPHQVALGEQTGSMSCYVHETPDKGHFTINIYTSNKDVVEITIYDMHGTLMQRECGILCNGYLIKALNLATVPDGVYVLRVKGGCGMLSKKISIRR